MDGCPNCGHARCDCVATDPLGFVRAVLRRELRHLEETELALLSEVERLRSEDTRIADSVALQDLAHRFRIRYLAVVDVRESIEQALTRFGRGRVPVLTDDDFSIEQRQISPRPDTPS